MTKISYAGYRFPSEIIQQAIWLYLRFTLSFCDVEDLLAEQGSWRVRNRGRRRVTTEPDPRLVEAAKYDPVRPELGHQLGLRPKSTLLGERRRVGGGACSRCECGTL
jgi:hypothetical protein